VDVIDIPAMDTDNRQEHSSNLAAMIVPQAGRLVETVDPWEPCRLLDPAGVAVGAVAAFLRDLQAAGRSPATLRSYGMDLLRWFRFLLCTCQASGCESVGSCWLSVTAFAAGHGASAETCWRTTATTATFPEAVREIEEVVPVNVSTWVLPSGVTVGR
jgi:hypothetical protein